MDTVYDILILGAGPAGVSGALTAHARGRSVLVVSNDPMDSPLAKAPAVDNYPGLTGMSGKELLAAMLGGLDSLSIPRVTGRVTGVMPFGNTFMATVGQEIYTARSLILAVGMAPGGRPYPGEREYLGSGVSYCATCDGMLYRGRRVAVIGLASDGEEEARFLRDIGCEAEYFDRKRARTYEVLGRDGHVTALKADGIEYPVDGVFILRNSVASSVLLPGLEERDGHIAADRDMRTSIPGVFAAGDCIGRPYQAAKAAGEGNLAALSADAYLKEISS